MQLHFSIHKKLFCAIFWPCAPSLLNPNPFCFLLLSLHFPNTSQAMVSCSSWGRLETVETLTGCSKLSSQSKYVALSSEGFVLALGPTQSVLLKGPWRFSLFLRLRRWLAPHFQSHSYSWIFLLLDVPNLPTQPLL